MTVENVHFAKLEARLQNPLQQRFTSIRLSLNRSLR
jgi:hypothetical protein